MEESPRWQRTGALEFYNADLQVTARRELTQKCLTNDLMRENFEVRFPDIDFDKAWYETHDWVYYNSEGKLLIDDSPNSEWRHKQVIRHLPSPDWRATTNEFWELMDYLDAEQSGDFDHKFLFLEETNLRDQLETNSEIYKEIARLLNEK